MITLLTSLLLFFFSDTATTKIYTLSLHDALPISRRDNVTILQQLCNYRTGGTARAFRSDPDRKSTRLNSSHGYISYAVFCLKKKKNTKNPTYQLHVQTYTEVITDTSTL